MVKAAAAGTRARPQTREQGPAVGARKQPIALRQNARPAAVPAEYRSGTPQLLRSLLSAIEGQFDVPAQKLLSDAAAEIEGGEEAYAVLVGEIEDLRLKLARAEAHLRATIDLVPRRGLD